MRLNWNPPSIPKAVGAEFEWTADYAADVHEGEPFLNGARGVARPFTEVAIARNNLPQIIAAEFRKTGDLPTAFDALVDHLEGEFDDVIDNHDWGIQGRQQKVFRNSPTWQTITDSGELRDSLSITPYVEP